MAEVRSKMTDVKSQLEARGGVAGGATGVEQGLLYHADSDLATSRTPTETDLMGKVPGASRHCRSGGKKASSPNQERSSMALRRTTDAVEKEMRSQAAGDASSDQSLFPRVTPSASEGGLKPRSTHSSPPSLGSSDNKLCSSSHDQQPHYGADLYALGGLNGISTSTMTRPRTQPMGASLLTDSSLDCDSEETTEIQQSLLSLAEGPCCPEEGRVVQKQAVAPAMSSDSEIDCDTENEDEAVALEAGECCYDARALPCSGDQLISDDLSFTTGENTERSLAPSKQAVCELFFTGCCLLTQLTASRRQTPLLSW
ncbi:hypothetical protein UPYG_G00122500 [Umbra pygmaea]|uniref:Uncharacterized protein n=1 Tax=Umbra pygmaea TaxID=75934 RepID=A0ABD0X995_UMBPY